MARIFISYRREDTSPYALLIHRELEAKYGRGEIFMDLEAIRAGVDFVAEIEAVLASCDVVLVLIGRFWAISQDGAPRLQEPKDLVRQEIAASLARWREKRTHLIPVLAPGTSMPKEEELPDELRGLERINAVKLNHDLWEASIEGLLRSIERLLAAPAVPRSTGLAETAARPAITQPSRRPPATPPPAEHFAAVAAGIFGGRVAFFLGPGVNLCERDERAWDPGVSQFPPSYPELAAHVARVLHVDEFLDTRPEHDSLETVADFAETILGQAPLYDALRSVFASEFSSTLIHRALVRIASLVRDHDGRGLLVATVNYDDILERALAEAGVLYDVVSYVAAGEHRGKFLHYPAGGHPVVVERANEYADVTEHRPVILKLLGGIDREEPERDSYVVSEEDQVDYASRGDIWRMIPITVPAQIRKSDLLFLGLSPRPRLFRVVLEKMFGGWQPPRAWAVHLDPDVLSRGEWTRRGVDVFDTDLVHYVELLMGRVDILASGER